MLYLWLFTKTRGKQDCFLLPFIYPMESAGQSLVWTWSWSFWRGIHRVFRSLTRGWPGVSQGRKAGCWGKQEPRVMQLTFFPCFAIISRSKGTWAYRTHQAYVSQQMAKVRLTVHRQNLFSHKSSFVTPLPLIPTKRCTWEHSQGRYSSRFLSVPCEAQRARGHLHTAPQGRRRGSRFRDSTDASLAGSGRHWTPISQKGSAVQKLLIVKPSPELLIKNMHFNPRDPERGWQTRSTKSSQWLFSPLKFGKPLARYEHIYGTFYLYSTYWERKRHFMGESYRFTTCQSLLGLPFFFFPQRPWIINSFQSQSIHMSVPCPEPWGVSSFTQHRCQILTMALKCHMTWPSPTSQTPSLSHASPSLFTRLI